MRPAEISFQDVVGDEGNQLIDTDELTARHLSVGDTFPVYEDQITYVLVGTAVVKDIGRLVSEIHVIETSIQTIYRDYTSVNVFEAQPLIAELAHLFARQRTHGSVYMDGSHNPVPSEMRIAKEFVEFYVVPIIKKNDIIMKKLFMADALIALAEDGLEHNYTGPPKHHFEDCKRCRFNQLLAEYQELEGNLLEKMESEQRQEEA